MSTTPNRFPGPVEAEELEFEDRTVDGNPTVDGAVRFVGDDFVGKTSTGVKSLTAAALPPATAIGQFLVSVDGLTFTRRSPVVSTKGWMFDLQGRMVVGGFG